MGKIIDNTLSLKYITEYKDAYLHQLKGYLVKGLAYCQNNSNEYTKITIEYIKEIITGLPGFAKEMNLCSSHSKTNKPLGRETIYAMLKNPFYYGEMVIRGEIMPHAYEPLISKSLYDKVQEIRSGGKIHTKMREYAGIPFVFRGLIKCAECNGTI